MGCGRDDWLVVTIKELIDNGLDACEEARISPAITVEEQIHSRFTVTDNGPGMSPELVAKLCDLSARTSTREAFAAPDRGSQGNALPTLLALPLGFGLDEAVTTIVSRGVEHTITLRADRLAQRITVERVERLVALEPGVAVTMTWPGGIDHGDVAVVVYRHALLNGHAWFRLFTADGHERSHEPCQRASKWNPGLPIPAHWYTAERFAHRVLLELRRDPEITVAQFLGGFKGLTNRRLRSLVARMANLSYQPLAALLDGGGTSLDPERTAALLVAMQNAGRAPKAAVLGAAGEPVFATWVGNMARHVGSNPDQSRESRPPVLCLLHH